MLKRLMERSTSKETATKMANTVATDHVGVKANDLVSCSFSAAILNYPKTTIQTLYVTKCLKKNVRQLN